MILAEQLQKLSGKEKTFFLTSCVCQPLFSLSSNTFGRKLALWIAILAFTVGSITATLSYASY
jgi:MFS family permease